MRLGLGLGVNKGRKASGGNDPAITALLDQSATDGATPMSGVVLEAANTLVSTLKTEAVWNELDLFYVFATNGDSDFATYNWIDPSTFPITKTNNPTFTTLEGFTGDAISMYLNTGWTPSTHAVKFALGNSSWGFYSRGGGTRVGYDSGFNSANFYTSEFATLAFFGRWQTTGSTNVGGSVSGDGFNHFAQVSSDLFANLDGVQKDTKTATISALPTAPLTFLSRGANGYSDTQISIGFAGSNLEDKKIVMYNAVQAYMTALGTNV